MSGIDFTEALQGLNKVADALSSSSQLRIEVARNIPAGKCGGTQVSNLIACAEFVCANHGGTNTGITKKFEALQQSLKDLRPQHANIPEHLLNREALYSLRQHICKNNKDGKGPGVHAQLPSKLLSGRDIDDPRRGGFNVDFFKPIEDTPQPTSWADYNSYTEPQNDSSHDAAPSFLQRLTDAAHRARQAMDDIPQYVDSNVPLFAKIATIPVLAPAGFTLGALGRTYDTVASLPDTVRGFGDGSIGFAEIGQGMWQMVKNDAAAIPETAQLMLNGSIMTAYFKVGTVAYDVVPAATAVGGVLKSLPQIFQLASGFVEVGAVAVRGAFAMMSDAAEVMGQLVRMEPEIVMAGVPARLPIATVAADGLPTSGLKMVGTGRPIEFGPRMTTTTPKKLGQAPTQPHVADVIAQQLKWDPSKAGKLRRLLNDRARGRRIDHFDFSTSHQGRLPTGLEGEKLGEIAVSGRKVDVYYDLERETVHIVLP